MPRPNKIVVNSLLNKDQLESFSKKSPLPLYHKLHQMLRQAIQSGAAPSGSHLPTEQELEVGTGVSRVTVRRAMDELAAEGLVNRRRGIGSIVSYTPPPVKAVNAPLVAMLENLEEMGRNTQVEVIAVSRVEPPPNVAVLYQTDQPLLHTQRTRSQNGVIFGYYQSWSNIKNIPTNKKLFKKKARLVIFREAGITFSSIYQTLKGVAAPASVAAHLGVPEGTPLTSLVRFSYDQKEVLVDYLEAYYNPELFEYRMELKTP